MYDLSTLLNLTNKYLNAAPAKVQSTPIKKRAPKQTQSSAVKSKHPELFSAGELRRVTKVSPPDHPDMSGAPFDNMRTALWIKVSRVFSSKKKTVSK